jgi:hypothetical protein
LAIKDLILCDFLPKSFGIGIALTTTDQGVKDGPTFQFNNLGESGRLANFLI